MNPSQPALWVTSKALIFLQCKIMCFLQRARLVSHGVSCHSSKAITSCPQQRYGQRARYTVTNSCLLTQWEANTKHQLANLSSTTLKSVQVSPVHFLLIKTSLIGVNLDCKYSQTGIQWQLQPQPQPSCRHQLKREKNELLTTVQHCLESKLYNRR